MPQRNSVPTLKLMCIRCLAWPAGLRSNGELDETWTTQTVNPRPSKSRISRFFSRNNSKGSSKTSNDIIKKQQLTSLANVEGLIDAIINGWIRLSNYYGMKLDQLDHLSQFLYLKNLSTLDFLHEGSTLRDGTEWFEIAGALPVRIIPQPVTPETWNSITATLKETGNIKKLTQLSISFGLPEAGVAGGSSPSRFADFKFLKTIRFSNLAKLVVTGTVDDNFLRGIGRECSNLIWLDVRGCTDITEFGVLFLLLKTEPVMSQLAVPRPTIHHEVLRPLTKLLQYLDLSSVPKRFVGLDLSKIVTQCCPSLRAAPNRFFFLPAGSTTLIVKLEKRNMMMSDLKTIILSRVQCPFIDVVVAFIPMLRANFQFGVSLVELREKEEDGKNEGGSSSSSRHEPGILYSHMDKVIAHLTLENITAVTLTTYTPSPFDFIPLEFLAHYTPFLRRIKAPLKGQLTRVQALTELKSITSPMIHSIDTLKSLILFGFKLQYVEIREILISTNGTELNDFDIHEMMLNGPYESLEVFRLLFPNQVSLVPGVKEITLNCPTLCVLGDLKYWKTIPFNTLSRFLTNMSTHNFEFTFEYDGVLYPTNTVCKEFKT